MLFWSGKIVAFDGDAGGASLVLQDHSDEFALERHVHDVTALAIDADAARWREPGVDRDWVERLETVGLLLAAE